jgi:hypothetical protein
MKVYRTFDIHDLTLSRRALHNTHAICLLSDSERGLTGLAKLDTTSHRRGQSRLNSVANKTKTRYTNTVHIYTCKMLQQRTRRRSEFDLIQR